MSIVDFGMDFVYNNLMTKKHKPASAKGFGEAKKQVDYLEEWKGERAGFLNYKKDEAERIEKSIKFCNEKFLLEVLDILDNIYLAEEKLPEELEDSDWVVGVLKIKEQILEFLKSNCVEEIDCLNKEFDPNFHEAIEMVDSKSKSNYVIEEINKGYILHDKVIRPSRVKIAK